MSVLANITQSTKASLSDRIEFEITQTHIDDLEQMSYTTYGIRAIGGDGNAVAHYPDISTSKELVQEFLDMVKDRDIAAIHVRDLIEDFLD